ncbi:MAG: hypothetical protein ABIL76_06725, partial [candidate division WOR-3 bacterium]
SRNLAEGYGSFLKPLYTLTIYNEFYEHPPLQFILESLFFKIFKDHFWTEKLYSTMVGLLSLISCSIIIKIINKYENLKLPLFSASFVLISIPLTSWIILNNMLENTLVLFLLLSFIFLLLSIYKNPLFSTISGLFLFLSFFSKGPVCLFIIIFPFFYLRRLSFKNILIIVFFLLVGFSLFLFNESIFNYLKIYFKNQVLNSVLGHREIVGNRYDPILKTIKEIIVPFLFLFIISISKRLRIYFDSLTKKFLILSVIAVLPLTISPKQMDWYVYPSFPFFSITISLIFRDTFYEIENVFKFNFIKVITTLILLICLLISIKNYGKISKYQEFHIDFKNFKPSSQKVVGVCPKSLINDWVLIALSQRYLKFSFDLNVDSVIFSTRDCNLKCSKIYPPNYKNYYICYNKSI